MNDNELLLQDRIQKIKQVILKYGEENFYISFSGGKDSCVVSDLVDWALPKNKIPRVYANTGIELNMIRDFVYDLQKKDDRIVIIKPSKNIKNTLEEFGYPFKSKEHSLYLSVYQNNKFVTKSVNRYLNPEEKRKSFGCPKILNCPFIIKLQEELDVLEEYFPAERKQCELIWKPVYDEYRRIGYRLK